MIDSILSDYKIPKKHHAKLRAIYKQAKKLAILQPLVLHYGIRLLGQQQTEQANLYDSVKSIWDGYIDPDDITQVTMTAKGRTIKTSYMFVIGAIAEELQKVIDEGERPKSKKPQSLKTHLIKCYSDLAVYLFKNKLITHKGEPSKNKIAQIIADIISDAHSQKIELPQITRTLSKYL